MVRAVLLENIPALVKRIARLGEARLSLVGGQSLSNVGGDDLSQKSRQPDNALTI